MRESPHHCEAPHSDLISGLLPQSEWQVISAASRKGFAAQWIKALTVDFLASALHLAGTIDLSIEIVAVSKRPKVPILAPKMSPFLLIYKDMKWECPVGYRPHPWGILRLWVWLFFAHHKDGYTGERNSPEYRTSEQLWTVNIVKLKLLNVMPLSWTQCSPKHWRPVLHKLPGTSDTKKQGTDTALESKPRNKLIKFWVVHFTLGLIPTAGLKMGSHSGAGVKIPDSATEPASQNRMEHATRAQWSVTDFN